MQRSIAVKMNLLAVGDVVGDRGIAFLGQRLRPLKKLKNIEITVVNGENASGVGITPRQAEELFQAGADLITLGNHTWNRREIVRFLDENPYIFRPANYPPQNPGRGWGIYDTGKLRLRVVNLIGRRGMDFGPDNPFLEINRILAQDTADFTVVDFHAEATSEKLAMAYYLDGRVSVLFGTHTHVQTADERVLPKGTGYITDLGMTGPVESVLGIRVDQSVDTFLGNPTGRYETAPGDYKMECAIFELDTDTGLCSGVERLRIL